MEYSIGNIRIMVLETSNIDWGKVAERVKRFPEQFLELIDNIYVGRFQDLERKAVNAAYLDGGIYMIPHHTSIEDAVDDIMHELGHAYEEAHKDFIYGDQDIAYEFVAKRRHLKSIMKSQGFDISGHDFESIDYDFDLDEFYFINVGYPLMQAMTTNMFLSPYAATSLREFFATGFEDYFLFKRRKQLQKTCPALFKKLEEIEETFYEN